MKLRVVIALTVTVVLLPLTAHASIGWGETGRDLVDPSAALTMVSPPASGSTYAPPRFASWAWTGTALSDHHAPEL